MRELLAGCSGGLPATKAVRAIQGRKANLNELGCDFDDFEACLELQMDVIQLWLGLHQMRFQELPIKELLGRLQRRTTSHKANDREEHASEQDDDGDGELARGVIDGVSSKGGLGSSLIRM